MSEGYSIVIQEYLPRLLEPITLCSLLAVILLAAVLFIISRKTNYNTSTLAYGAAAIAMSFALSYVVIMKFPNGGSITVASMLPLFIFSFVAGPKAGMMAGLCYGMLQYIQDPQFYHWAQFLLDYPLAFSALGLAGLFREKVFAGALAGSAARLICHLISGIVFFASYAGDQNVFIYSLAYNASYILPDTAICLVILAVPSVRRAIDRIKREGLKKAA